MMTERYSFAVDRHLVDGSVVWSQDNVDIVNSTLADTIHEGYVTAEEDSPTRYLSVLDTTNEISLENLNITLANPKLEVEEDTGNFITEEATDQVEESNDQVVVFSVEGSDELYGIQVVQDEEGNLQKFQFQFRKNEQGQLEAIPETITLIPMEEDGQEGVTDNLEGQATFAQEVEDEEHSMHLFVEEDSSNTHILPDDIEEHEQNLVEEEEEPDLFDDEAAEQESMDIKPGLVSLQHVKQEMQEHHVEFEVNEPIEEQLPETFVENLQHEEMAAFEETSEDAQQPEVNLMEYATHIQTEENSLSNEQPPHLEYQEKAPEETEESIQNVISSQEYEHVEVNPDVNIAQTDENIGIQEEVEEFHNETANDSDENDYQIVEGLHITGDVEGNESDEHDDRQTTNTNILKHALKVNKEQHKIVKKDNRLYLYVVQHPEKENVDSLTMEMSNLCRPKVNPRSILKSSHAMFQAKNEIESDQQEDERLNKRFARCKEAMQARNFHNFINKTTIPQAPVRKNRLPRKQKIKPVERMDEEIVVQEVMVSSNGFVETAVSGGGVFAENLSVITDYVELSDSDDDYDPKKISRKKKKHRRKRIEITISDDSDSSHSDSVIELDESDEETNKSEERTDSSNNNNTLTKRRRGRPPKNKSSECITNTDSPAKKTRVDSTDAPTKPEIPCPKCDKTFPSQNSLKTHLQHHNLQSSIKRALPEYKYKCDKCATTFINNILLRKHMCSKLFTCAVCKKKFEDLAALSVHKRTHAKEQMVKSTTTVRVSPKKIKSPQTSAVFKAPRATNTHKCKTCGKVCSSLQNLNVHAKSHKEFVCGTCSATFVSQLMLEKHVREKCVKSPHANRRSMSAGSMGKKTSPIGTRCRVRSAASPPRKTLQATRSTVSTIKVRCDKCEMQFSNHQAVFKHKVLKHGLETPDKTVLKSSKDAKGEAGMPAASRLRNVYAELGVQLDFNE